ncbi:uncharacterized protein LOC129220640 [Uloborus diversus]|uniref:uncharacterized protein LOC129220640 n=1 Tax=Uloborus diversus TaxID=327109 RepID=UPI00240A74DC|nr:uncharacterized protein LOC129220640 [Uloborus diversus]
MNVEFLKQVRPELWVALGALIVTYVISSIVRNWKKNFPPGPIGLPIVGYMPFLTKKPHEKLTQLSKKYGDVYSIRLGSELVVVLNGTKAIREGFSKSELLARPPTSPFALFGSSDNESPFFLSGVHIWQEQRKFVVQSMKDLGLGKSKIEGKIQDEIHYFLEVLRNTKGQPIDLKEPLTPSMSNNIASLVFGARNEYKDPERIQFDEALDETARSAGQTASHIFFPWIRYIPFILKLLDLDKAVKAGLKIEEVYRKKIKEHLETLDPKHPRDYIDSYLIEMEARKKKDPNTSFTYKTLIGSTGDLFGAGSETVRTSVGWCMYILAAYPEVQRKVQKEIIDVIGSERSPEFPDQKDMPFTHSVLLEVSRWQTTVPLNILRYTVADTTVCGYDIPKDTIVLGNFYSAHRDPNNWEDPDTFKPDRFLAPDKKSVVKSPNLIPFSVGKRVCPGEMMATMEIFLYVTSILQKFDVAFPDGYKPNFEGELGVTYALKPHKLRFIAKNYFWNLKNSLFRMQFIPLTNTNMELMVVVGSLVVAYLIIILVKNWRSGLPPGPIGLPVVGYIPFLTRNVHLKFQELAMKYGEVFSVRLGSELVVVLNGTKSIREAFAKSEFLGRPPISAFSIFGNPNNESPFFIGGVHVWQEQRKFVVHAMKDLGLGKTKIEGHIQDEISHFLEVLKSHNGEPIDVMEPLTPSMSNNISSLVFGTRYDYKDPERLLLDHSLDEVSRIAGQTAVHIFFPWIKYVPFIVKFFEFEKALAAANCMENVYRKQIQKHKETLDPKNPRDFVDSYLIEMEERQKKTPDTSFTSKTLIGSAGDLFGAGSETVRTSIAWCLYTMAGYPEVQKKVQKEILDVLGPDRNPEFSDQKNMPYTHSVLLEISRWRTTVPLNILRYTLADTSVCGHNIPKNTIVLANFWAVHHDPNNWENPDKFEPERFLSTDGKSIVKSIHLMPFSVGKRVCPGETFANMELFLYFVSIFQKFDVVFPDGFKPTFVGQVTLTCRPEDHKISFIAKS